MYSALNTNKYKQEYNYSYSFRYSYLFIYLFEYSLKWYCSLFLLDISITLFLLSLCKLLNRYWHGLYSEVF